MGWVSFEDNIAICVDKDDVGDTLNLEILVSCAASIRSQVVLDVGPTLVRDVRSELV